LHMWIQGEGEPASASFLLLAPLVLIVFVKNTLVCILKNISAYGVLSSQTLYRALPFCPWTLLGTLSPEPLYSFCPLFR